jgi:hypothetical protein
MAHAADKRRGRTGRRVIRQDRSFVGRVESVGVQPAATVGIPGGASAPSGYRVTVHLLAPEISGPPFALLVIFTNVPTSTRCAVVTPRVAPVGSWFADQSKTLSPKTSFQPVLARRS